MTIVQTSLFAQSERNQQKEQLELLTHYFVNESYQTVDDVREYGKNLQKTIDELSKDKPYRIKLRFYLHLMRNMPSSIHSKAVEIIMKYDNFVKDKNLIDYAKKKELISKFVEQENLSELGLLKSYFLIKYNETVPSEFDFNYREDEWIGSFMIMIGLSGREALNFIVQKNATPIILSLHQVPLLDGDVAILDRLDIFNILNIYNDKNSPGIGYNVSRKDMQRYNLFLEGDQNVCMIYDNEKVSRFLINLEARSVLDASDTVYKTMKKN